MTGRSARGGGGEQGGFWEPGDQGVGGLVPMGVGLQQWQWVSPSQREPSTEVVGSEDQGRRARMVLLKIGS